jgi:hypothetical protein
MTLQIKNWDFNNGGSKANILQSSEKWHFTITTEEVA